MLLILPALAACSSGRPTAPVPHSVAFRFGMHMDPTDALDFVAVTSDPS